MSRAPAGFLCALAVSAAGLTLQAHEIGTTRVDLIFEQDRRYLVEIVTDAASLVEKLQAVNGGEPESIPPEQLPARLRALDSIFRTRLELAFDGQAVQPEIEYRVESSADTSLAPRARIHLAGELPPHAGHFAWTYAWTFAPYSFNVGRGGSDRRTTRWLEGGQSTGEMALETPESPGRLQIATQYLRLGFTHIVPKGLDHVLFVLGIFLLNRRLRPVLWQVTAFTAAHSITLALSMSGAVTIAPSVVEPLIALSIAYVAIENLFVTELRIRRVALVFSFGLLHGLGFAGVLRDLGLPRSEAVTALLTFNLGVEAGQLVVIGAAFLLAGWTCGAQSQYRQRVVVPASVAIAAVALYWTVARLPF